MTSKTKTTGMKVDTKQFEEAVAVGKQNVERAVEATREQVEQAVAATKEQVEKASETAMKSYDEISKLNKETFDAMAKCNNALVKGGEEMGKAYFSFFKNTADANVEAMKAIMGAKSLNEVVEIQSDFARTSFDTFVAESTKLSEMGVKVATDAFQPIQSQVNVAVERAMKPIAA